jgi:hypothetical protein
MKPNDKLKLKIKEIFQSEDEIHDSKVKQAQDLHKPDFTEQELEEGKKKKKIHKTKRGWGGYLFGQMFSDAGNDSADGAAGEGGGE